MKKYGAGTSVPSNSIENNGTEVPAPEKSKNGIKVPAPKINETEISTSNRRFLPHVDMLGYYQFLTFRTHDSLDDFIKKIRFEDISSREQEYKIDQYIDTSLKGCYLNGEVLDYLKNYFISKDKSFYDLVAFSIMPNHVHMLFKQNIELPKIMKFLKGSTAFQINKILNRKGSFWESNYYDKIIRDEIHFDTVYEYIKNNPLQAGLKDYKKRFYSVYEK